jgi:phytanoyl-CoA hydroxylase
LQLVTDDVVRQYRDEGYVHIPSILAPAELERLSDVSRRMIALGQSVVVPHHHWEYRVHPRTGEKVFCRVNFAKVEHVEFQALMGHPGLLSIFEALIGPNFIPIDDSLVIKPPDTPVEFPWHRDTCPGLSRAGDAVAVAGIELDRATVANGCVHVLPRTHLLGDVDPVALTAQHGFALPGAIPLETEPGDLLVHSANLLHGSQPNSDTTMRRTVYIGAMDIDEYVAVYEAPEALVRLQMRFMLRGIQLRRRLYADSDEAPFCWRGDAAWHVDLSEEDVVEWDLPAHSPAA